MSTENPVAARLLQDARRRTAKSESPKLGKAAVIVSPVPILALALGATALGLGSAASRRPVSARRAKIAMLLGTAAILLGAFFYIFFITRG